jgi:CubicO group peptidase (beta-lactamase class C family)
MTHGVASPESMNPENVSRAVQMLRDYAVRLSTQTPVPGGSLVVVDRGGVVAELCFGLADVAAAVPVRPDHRFEIGSISKVFTSLLVNQLVDEGLVDLDRPVTEVLPWLDLGTPSAPATARHLLAHTAGLVVGADGLPDELAQVWGLRDLTRSDPLGGRFHYSNLGFMVLGVLASHVTGQPFAELVRRRLFAPMGMPDALSSVTHDDRATMATGYWPLHDDRPWVPGDAITPATWFEVAAADGNVAADADELGRLVRLLLGSGELDGRRVVSAEAMERIATPAAPGGEDIAAWRDSPGSTDSRYGLGLNVERVDGHLCVTHGGGMVGYASFVLADRDSGIGVGVLTNGNGDHPAAQLLARVAHRTFLAAREGVALPVPTDPTATVHVVELDPAMLGVFDAAMSGGAALRITVDADETGAARVGSGTGTGRLYRTWSGRFATDHPDLRRFHLTWNHGAWTHGPSVLRRERDDVSAPVLPPRWAAAVGHYRCYSPWYPNFRIVDREGRLVLVAPGGVEAPGDEPELVEVEPGVFRIGADPWLPERLVLGPAVEGRIVSATRDGCVYSRAFTD